MVIASTDGPRPAAVINRPDAPPRPSGPPPNAVPLTAIKPPPRAPPPIALQQTQQRPQVGDGPTGAANTQAQPKPPMTFPPAPVKAGGISMFEEIEEKTIKSDAPAEKKPKLSRPQEPPIDLKGIPLPRGPPPTDAKGVPSGTPLIPTLGRPTSRPQPPTGVSAGIPAGQPQPPAYKPESDARPPVPVKPPPKNRAPPKEEPSPDGGSRVSSPLTPAAVKPKIVPSPPTTEPPFLRGKKPVVEKAAVKRRERDMPEFEESDDDEEKPDLVKQPKPFGVLKQPVPPSPLEMAALEEKERERKRKEEEAEAAAAAKLEKERIESAKRQRLPSADSNMSTKQKAADSILDAPPPMENRMTEFAPPPPSEPAAFSSAASTSSAAENLGKFFDDSKLGKTLTLGRLSMKCIEGYEIRKKDEKDVNARLDPFIKFRLGVAERHPWKRTATKRKQNSNPKFDNEIVFFDITDPSQYVFQEDVQVCIEVWNKSSLADELIGSVSMSVVRFLLQPFVVYTEKVPIYYPAIARTQMKVHLQ